MTGFKIDFFAVSMSCVELGAIIVVFAKQLGKYVDK
jgi:hypothetical protein